MRLIILFSLFFYVLSDILIEDYNNLRTKLLQDESLLTIGGQIILNDKETIVNNCLMKYKFQELDYGFDNPEYFNFSRHFFTYKDEIKNSKVYKIIKDMPKGSVLHIHDMGILSPDYLLNLTYKDNLYICFEKPIKLMFAANEPKKPCAKSWTLMSVARKKHNNKTDFDAHLRKFFTLVVDNPDTYYPSITDTWKKFMNYFSVVQGLLSYKPIWEKYFYDALKKFHEDNIMYVEIRSVLPELYELDGSTYDSLVTAKAYQKVIKSFKKNNPEFFGAKLIYAPPRHVDRYKVSEYIKTAKQIKKEMPETFAGFDLVGQEDLGSPLIEFVPQLLEASKDLNFFFHAGETNWYGTLTDENLVDAILLGAKRIGHAYALPKRPLLLRKVLENDIGLEVNVISNGVLSLVHDERNHPLSTFIAQGLPVVISSDDPGAWEADSISDDYYVAFVGIASRLSDLRLLKQLAINTIKYSSLNESQKIQALRDHQVKWNNFVNNFKCSAY